MMDGLLTRCTAQVESHGGTVLHYAGDSLLAVFGAARSRDDAARVVLDQTLDHIRQAARSTAPNRAS